MRILITAGPTREYLDPVRYLSNASSGKLGYAIAAEAARRGHQVELLSGPVSIPPPKGVRVTNVVTSAEMFDAAVRLFGTCDAAIMAAAVCDYRSAKRSTRKLEKKPGGLSLALRPTRDIAAFLGRRKGKRILVGFALESHDEHRHAESKLRRKRLDAIVLNRPETIGADHAAVQILHASQGWEKEYCAIKRLVARKIVGTLEDLLATA